MQFFDKVLWPKSELNIFLEYGDAYAYEADEADEVEDKNPAEFGRYLADSEGNVLAKPSKPRRYPFERLGSKFGYLVKVISPSQLLNGFESNHTGTHLHSYRHKNRREKEGPDHVYTKATS